MKALKELDVWGKELSDISGPNGLAQLRKLTIKHVDTTLETIPFEGLPKLEWLEMESVNFKTLPVPDGVEVHLSYNVKILDQV